MVKTKPNADAESDLVSFRLDAEFRKLLRDEAARQGQDRPSLFARTLVQRALTDSGGAELRHEVERLHAEVRKAREDVATLAFVLLVKLAKEDPEKAKAWVREHLAP